MKRRTLYLSVLCTIFSSLYAQDEALYLRSDVDHIETNLYRDIEKNKAEIARKSESQFRAVRLAALKNFIAISAFEANQLQNGNSIYNKEALSLVQKVMDEIIKANEKDYDLDVRVYIARTQGVNAFATDNGNIWVTLGLLNKIQTEAQLAYILCHELSHFIKKHSYEKVTNTAQQILEGKVSLIGIHDYSKDTELEADELGFELYVHTDYNLAALDQVFDILTQIILPDRMQCTSIQYPFTGRTVDAEKIKEPPTFDQDKYEEEDPEFSTHPSIGDRRIAIAYFLKNFKKEGHDKDFIHLSETELKEMHKKCAYTLAELYLIEDNYLRGMAHNTYLLEQYPEDEYVKYNLMMNWIQAAYYSRDGLKRYNPKYLYGEEYVLSSALEYISSQEIFANMLLSAVTLYESHPENLNYRHAIQAALYMCARHFDESDLNKNELLEVLDDKDTKEVLDSLKVHLDKKLVKEFFKEEDNQEAWKLSDIEEDKILFINPLSMKIDQSDLLPYDIVKSNELSLELADNLSAICKQYGLNHETIMISKELNTNPALSDDTYIARLIFKSTQANKGEEDNKTARFSFYMQPNAAAKLREKYDCRYIAYVLEFENNPGTFKFRDFGLKFIFTYSFICAVPQVFIGTFVEKYQLSYILLVYDLEENKYVYADEKEIRTTTHHQTMRKIYLNSLIYDAL